MLTTKTFIFRSNPHTGVAPGAYKKTNKQTNKQTNDRVSILPPRRAFSDPELFSLGHVLWLACNVQRAQSSYRAYKVLASCAHLDDAHLSILTREHFFHSTQMPLTAWSILINNEHYIPNLQVFFSLSTKKWLGVNTGSSRGSAPSYVNGLEFINASTSLIAVCSSSSVSPAFPTIAFRVFLTTLTSDSNTPPKCDPSREFQFHLSPLLATLPTICSWSIAWTSSLSSLSAPTKFVSLSLVTSSGLPLVATIQLNAYRKSVVLNEHAISRCTALVAEHVNRHKYLSAETLRVILVVKGLA